MSKHNLDYKTGIDEATQKAMGLVRDAFMEVEKAITICCPECREASLSFTKMEESLMWAIKSLAVYGTIKVD